MDDLAVDVGETEVAARIAVGQFCVVDAHQVQDGGMVVMDVAGVGGDFYTIVIGFTICDIRVTGASLELE